MRRFFNILLGGLAMIAVALLSAFLTMRLVIHGREVEVPNVAGLTVAEASSLASGLGLNVNLENQFYSTVTPSGRVLSQSPAPGTKVRREWVLRITESIGPQRVSVPNVVGETEREASVTIRRCRSTSARWRISPRRVRRGSCFRRRQRRTRRASMDRGCRSW